MRGAAVLLAAMCGLASVQGFAPAAFFTAPGGAGSVASGRRCGGSLVAVRMQAPDAHADRRAMILRGVASGLAVGLGVQRAAAEEVVQKAEPKPKFRRLPRIQFIAALGDPAASSGTGADKWGLWEEDPGPRGVRLGNYGKLAKTKGKAPAGWQFDEGNWWLEEHGLIMEAPGKLPAKKFVRDGKYTIDRAKYVVTGDREVTTVLTVWSDGRWELDKGTLYDVTHLPCRSALYTPADRAAPTCTPDKANKSDFPVTPGAPMPPVTGCEKQDYAVLFVLGAEA